MPIDKVGHERFDLLGAFFVHVEEHIGWEELIARRVLKRLLRAKKLIPT